MSSSCSSNCSAELRLIALGGCGCGIEVTNGIAYSVGCQYINYTSLIDECNCIENILINNQTPPVYLSDGERITVELELNNNCTLCSQRIFCDCSGTAFTFIRKNNKLFIRLGGKLIQKLMKS